MKVFQHMERIHAALRLQGFKVKEFDDDWRTRRARSDIVFAPTMVVEHHTGSPTTTNQLLAIIGHGPGLPGPLCHWTIERDGTILVIAAGYANHAGRNNRTAVNLLESDPPMAAQHRPGPDSGTFSANRRAFGIEVKANGSFTDAQQRSTVALEVAIVRELGLSRTSPPIAGHKDVTTRKPVDPAHDMAARRREVAALLAEGAGVLGPVGGVEDWPLDPGVFFGPEDDANTISGQQSFLADGVTRGHPVLLRWQVAAGSLEGDSRFRSVPDGLFGDETSRCAKAIQAAAGLLVDGFVGKHTWAATLQRVA